MTPPPMTLWERQSIGADIDNAKTTLSSWDGCMAESWCKYVNAHDPTVKLN